MRNTLICTLQALVLVAVASSFAQADNFMYFKKKAAAAGGGEGQSISHVDTQYVGPGAAVSAVVTKPTGTAEGDMLIAVVYKESVVAFNSIGSGFEEVTTATTAGDVAKMHVFKKVAGASEPADYTWAWTGSVYRSATVTAYASTGTISVDDFSTNAGDGTNSNNAVALSVDTTVTNVLLVYAGSNYNGGTWTEPTDFTPRRDNSVHFIADYSQASAGASGNKTGVCNASDDWTAILVSLKAL
jgi:hypothetical protein